MFTKQKIILTVTFILSIVGLMLTFRMVVNDKTPVETLSLPSPEQWESIKNDDQTLAIGQVEYKLRCYKCHGLYGEGTYKGVNLTDDTWLHGSDENAILTSIYYGAGNMRGYAKKLLDKDLHAITVYVKYLGSIAKDTKK